MRIVIHTQDVDYRDENGEWLDGDRRLIEDFPTTYIDIDETDIDCHGSDVAAAVYFLQREGVEEASIYPVPTSVQEWAWLSGSYTNPYTGVVTEKSAFIYDCDDIKRSVIFRALANTQVASAS